MDLANTLGLIAIGVTVFFGLAGLLVATGRMPSITPPWVQRTEEDVDTAPEDAPPEPAPVFSAARPASLGEAFFGREKELAELSEAFKEHRVVVISGSAGTGKSRLAAEYAHASRLSGYWTDAAETVTQTLVALAPELDVEMGTRSDDEIAADVRKRLEQAETSKLWVVDNLHDLAHLNELMNAVSAVRLLLTTRDARRNLLAKTASFHPLEVLKQDASINLLCSRSEDCDPNDGDLAEIAELVGRLPLALEMLAVRLGEPLQSPSKVLAQIAEAPTPAQVKAFEEAAGTSIPRADGVYATIAGTLAGLPADVRDQIAPLAYLADAPIPEALLRALADVDDDGVDRLLTECSRESVLTTREGSVVIHALTAAAIAATNPNSSLPTTIERAQQRLVSINEADPVALRAEVAHYEMLSTMAELGNANEAILRLGHTLAIAFHTIARYDDAVRLAEETFEAKKVLLGAEHPSTLKTWVCLAASHRLAGRNEEGLQMMEVMLPVLDRALGRDHEDTHMCRNNLGLAYGDAGRVDEAIPLHEATLAAYERLLGYEHPHTLEGRNNLSKAYSAAGRHEEALDLDEETLAARERLLGPDHPKTLSSRNNLASDYINAGRIDEAASLFEAALTEQRRVLGLNHPDTQMTRTNLAYVYRELDRDKDAERLEAEGGGQKEGEN